MPFKFKFAHHIVTKQEKKNQIGYALVNEMRARRIHEIFVFYPILSPVVVFQLIFGRISFSFGFDESISRNELFVFFFTIVPITRVVFN